MADLNRVVVDPAIRHGKPRIRGIRIPVTTILDLLAGGSTHEEILTDYPDLTREDIHAALAYAARLAQDDVGELESHEVA
jgi:uncharacterized protein (DUF433 family)